ncbi:hypothetical protein [Halorientalis litorea]|uniref:hypothetical protein n=1 Tax=Halorientalis litorea TaxID=2931977 RepID=UPI001FF68823|nr:hypothetical protein [Halorientalis litorea]
MTRGVLTYGSLLNEGELTETLSAESVADAVPVRVDGYRRSFNKPSKGREGVNGEKAILNAEPESGAWLNAVLVPEVPDDEFERYRAREYRYDLTDVPAAAVTTYDDGDGAAVERPTERLLAVSEGTLTDPRPIPYYARMCVEGAREWGEAFLADFLVTTHRI